MKTCPTCGARAFDDAEVCYGCLHRYDAGEESALRGDLRGMAVEGRRADPQRIAGPCAAMRPDAVRPAPATGPEGGAAATRPEYARQEAMHSGFEAPSMRPGAGSTMMRLDGSSAVPAQSGPSSTSRSGSAQEAAGPRVEPATEYCQAAPANQDPQPAVSSGSAAGWSVRFELPGYSPVLEADGCEGGLIVRFRPEAADALPDRKRMSAGRGTHARDAPVEGRVLVGAQGRP